jgi:VWFA-related protein
MLFLAVICPAQDEQPVIPDLDLSLEVRMVTLEAMVTDRQGKYISGLKKEDFEILVDGKPTPIAFFNEHAAPIREAGTSPTRPAGSEAVTDPLAVENREGNNFIVFLDDFYTNRLYRRPVILKFIQDLALLDPNDRMAIVRFKGKKLEVDAELTHDRVILENAFRHALKAKSGELTRKARLATRAHDEAVRALMNEQLYRVTKAIAAAMERFHTAKGRKLMLLVSEGWLVNKPVGAAGIQTFLAVDRLWQEKIRDLTEAASRFEFTIYPAELYPIPLPISAKDRYYLSGSDAAKRVGDHYHRTNTLHIIAQDTGGRVIPQAFVQDNVFKVAADDTHHYYTLGFQHAGDLEDHKVRVRVVGMKVRHRRNFQFLDDVDKAKQAVERSLLLGATETGLEVHLREPTSRRFRKLEVPVQIKIPMDWVTLQPLADGRYSCTMELRISAQDSYGDRAEMTVVPLSFEGGLPEKGAIATHEMSLKIRQRKQRLAFSLLDTNSGEILSRTLEFIP